MFFKDEFASIKMPLTPAFSPASVSLSLSPIKKDFDGSILNRAIAFSTNKEFGFRQIQLQTSG